MSQQYVHAANDVSIMVLNSMHKVHAVGGSIVHPAPSFDAGASLRAIRDEAVTDIPGVPAVIKSMLAHPAYRKEDMSSVQSVLLGGTTILAEDIKACYEGFGIKEVVVGYGMTENGVSLNRFYSPASTEPMAKVLPGMTLKVCHPETGHTLPVGESGELHVGSPTVIENYWLASDQEVDNPFYDDDHAHWIKTGDQAVMTKEGDIKIVGRYKDLIIRGGENVAPMALESVLLSDFGVQAEVVGFPDDIAGEVPVAVVKTGSGSAENLPRSEIKQALIRRYGAASAIETIVDVKDLGVDDYPKTVSGKVQKNALRGLLVKRLEPAHQTEGAGSGDGDTLALLLKLWARLLGVEVERLSPETLVTEWADSLVLARFPGALKRDLKMSIDLQEVMDHPNIGAQAELLESRTVTTSGYDDLLKTRDGPPLERDLPFVKSLQQFQDACETIISQLGLDWADVEQVTPLYSFQKHFLHRRRPQSNNHRHAWICKAGLSATRKALEASLDRNIMLRTMAIHSGTDFHHVAIRSSAKWFSQTITELGHIDSAEDLRRLKWNDPELDFAALPGPLFRVILAPIRGKDDRTGLVYMAQHSTFDGISLPFFTSDLNALLSGASAESLPQRVPFKPWVESLCALEESYTARISVQWHVDRLLKAGIGSCHDALFPPQGAPDWFKGDSTGWIDDETGKAGPLRQSLDKDGDGVTGISQKHDFLGYLL